MDTETRITTLQSRLFSVALGVGLLLASQLYDAGSTFKSARFSEAKIDISSAQRNLPDAAIENTGM
jgi:hypothetical protein